MIKGSVHLRRGQDYELNLLFLDSLINFRAFEVKYAILGSRFHYSNDVVAQVRECLQSSEKGIHS